jgi:hypothetical protein
LSGAKVKIARVLVAVAWMLALPAVVGCGSDDAGSSPSAAADAVGKYPGHSNDRGPAVEKQRLYERYAELSAAFDDHDVEAICRSFGTDISSLDQYDVLSAEGRRARCERDISAVLDEIDSGAAESPDRRVRWIRVYLDQAMVAGVTTEPVRDTSGPANGSIRLQFVKRGDEWDADFDIPEDVLGL